MAPVRRNVCCPEGGQTHTEEGQTHTEGDRHTLRRDIYLQLVEAYIDMTKIMFYSTS
jgi:hypothetical protein